MRRIVFFLTLIMATSICFANTINVPSDQSTVQDGINAAAGGDTVLIADGTYTGPGNRDIDFQGKPILVVSENGPEVTTINCQGSQSDPHRGFIFQNEETEESVLKGFTIKNSYSHNSGGAILCDINSAPLIVECILEDNHSEQDGGAAYCYINANVEFLNCLFKNNSSPRWGGGIACRDASPKIINCQFLNNIADFSGGVHFNGTSDPKVEYCLFLENRSLENGGGLGSYNDAYPDIKNCSFIGNRANDDGGGIFAETPIQIHNTIVAYSVNAEAIYGNVILFCCNLYNNEGGDYVGNHLSYQLGINGNISEDPMFCDEENDDYRITLFSPCNPYFNEECGLIGAYDVGCGEQPPFALEIGFGDSASNDTILTETPVFSWIYYDTAVTYQTGYEIEVGIDEDWSDAEMWSSGQVSSLDSLAEYQGLPLENATKYYMRIRLNNGIEWGTWAYADFYMHFQNIVLNVPGEYASIKAAVNAAVNGDTVLVAPGLYSGDNNTDIDFNGKRIAVVSEYGPEYTHIDCASDGPDSHSAFLFMNSEDSL
ncbi:MAG: hypothetical protein GF310_14150, partial [candidate division Zixibacteria bacterium]|nr:hypothetical protein [candidate division Zixibacteria bacterium]